MRNIFLSALLTCLVLSLFSPFAVAKDKKEYLQIVNLKNEATLAGKVLTPGKYTATLSDDGILTLSQKRVVVLKTQVDVQPLGFVNPNSFSMGRTGVIEEIRFKKEKAVFMNHSFAGSAAE